MDAVNMLRLTALYCLFLCWYITKADLGWSARLLVGKCWVRTPKLAKRELRLRLNWENRQLIPRNVATESPRSSSNVWRFRHFNIIVFLNCIQLYLRPNVEKSSCNWYTRQSLSTHHTWRPQRIELKPRNQSGNHWALLLRVRNWPWFSVHMKSCNSEFSL